MVDALQVDPANARQLSQALSERPAGQIAQLEAVNLRDADTPDPVAVELRWNRPDNTPRRP
jgi:hypothetical protein